MASHVENARMKQFCIYFSTSVANQDKIKVGSYVIIPMVNLVKLVLDIIPSSFADVTRAKRGQPKRLICLQN